MLVDGCIDLNHEVLLSMPNVEPRGMDTSWIVTICRIGVLPHLIATQQVINFFASHSRAQVSHLWDLH